MRHLARPELSWKQLRNGNKVGSPLSTTEDTVPGYGRQAERGTPAGYDRANSCSTKSNPARMAALHPHESPVQAGNLRLTLDGFEPKSRCPRAGFIDRIPLANLGCILSLLGNWVHFALRREVVDLSNSGSGRTKKRRPNGNRRRLRGPANPRGSSDAGYYRFQPGGGSFSA